jgi:UDP-N-acetylmuramoylalanine--D-glutamate ligase
MTFKELEGKSIIILGFGTEGQATYDFFRQRWPSKTLIIADQRKLQEFPDELLRRLESDPEVSLNFGPTYLDNLLPRHCEVIVKTPGIPASSDRIGRAVDAGCVLTSHSQIFLSNYPREKVIGITGTKGKSTTASLIYEILKASGFPAELVGNIGQPPLARLASAAPDSYFVYEFSSHQLAEIHTSPHIAVLLNIVPEHLDYYRTFDEYVAAKENITKFQEPGDFLVYNADYPVPTAIAERSKATRVPFRGSDYDERILPVTEIPLAGRFNLQNVMAAITASNLCDVKPEAITEAIRGFKALPHRLELVATYNGVTFYDDSIATVPDATLAALEALGQDVQTLILGGHERNLDFTDLGAKLPAHVRTVILFPSTGERIWKAIEGHSKNEMLPEALFVDSMEQAVAMAYDRTEPGKICLLSPASPSFGLFKDYKQRGDSYKAFVKLLSNSADIL